MPAHYAVFIRDGAEAEGLHERLLRSAASTFDQALADETKPSSPNELVLRFRQWVIDGK